jgi:dihydrolipoamide dehydrogenase
MAESSYDCIVIGSGPGGYVAAIRAAQLGLKTAVVERDKLGGRCLNYACIPAKAVLRSADLLTEIREAGDFGLKVSGVEVDYAAVQARRAKVVTTLTSGVGGLFKKDGIDVIEGVAKLTADTPQGGTPHHGGQAGGFVLVDVYDAEPLTIAAGSVILATGSAPRSIPGVPFGGRVIGTEEAWALAEVPARLTVVGAGASGARCIGVYTSTPVADVRASESSVSFSYGSESAEVDQLVICAGRGADVEGLGLAEAGVELDARGLVQVDGAMRTSRAGVYAIGDLVPGPALAHKASDEGIIAAETIAGRETHPIAYQDIPRATFCTPNVGSFGLTEEQAREQGYDVVVGKVSYGAVGGGTVYGDRTGLVKVVGESKYGELLGGHIVGARATELIQELVNVRALEGGFPELARIIHGHPTLSEAVMEAGRAADGWLIHG